MTLNQNLQRTPKGYCKTTSAIGNSDWQGGDTLSLEVAGFGWQRRNSKAR